MGLSMTPNEAHDYVLGVVKELQAGGIEVEVTPYPRKEDPDVLAKYGPGGAHNNGTRADPDQWCSVMFRPKTPEQANAIHDQANRLGWMGIGFDTGGAAGRRDWGLDWSFRYSPGTIDADREVARRGGGLHSEEHGKRWGQG